MSDLKNRRSDATATQNNIEQHSPDKINSGNAESANHHHCSNSCHCHNHEHEHHHDDGYADDSLNGIGACSCCGHDHNSHINRPLFFSMLALAIVICIVAMLSEHGILPWAIPENYIIWIYVVAYLIAGRSVLLNAFRHLLKGDLFNEFSLMTIATIGALLSGEYHESVSVMVLYSIGEFFQDLAINRVRRSIKSLLDLRPRTARVKAENGELNEIPVKSVSVGTVIQIRPYERLPLDGIVNNPSGVHLNPAALTGESIPSFIAAGEHALAGMINGSTPLELTVTRIFSDTLFAKTLRLVENAANNKSKIQNFITKFAKIYTPAVIGMAVLVLTIPYLLLPNYDFNVWLQRSLVFLVISCPCALVISIPLTYFSGIGLASKHGILFKGANYLDTISKINVFIFDKTGTLTKGKLAISREIIPYNSSPDRLRSVALRLEGGSNHPVALAIAEFCRTRRIIPIPGEWSVEEIPGKGIRAQCGEVTVLGGNPNFMQECNVRMDEYHLMSANAIVCFAINGEFIGAYMVEDEVKPDAKQAIDELRNLGAGVVISSGDRLERVALIGEMLNVNAAHGELQPDQKMNLIKQLQHTVKHVAFVGDGVNDAPSLALAEVGIAMGSLGSDAAVDVADVVIQDDSPRKVVDAIKISKLTRHMVMQNIYLVLVVKLFFLIGTPFGLTNMWEGVFADVGVTLLAVGNSLRLLYMYKGGSK